MSGSPSLFSTEALAAEASSSSWIFFFQFRKTITDTPVEQTLQASRISLLRAQKDTQDAFMRYTSCLDIERQARKEVAAAEKRRDDISEFS